MEEAVDAAKTDLIIHSIPTQHTPAFLAKHAELIPPRIPLICTSKGIHLKSQQLLRCGLTHSLSVHENMGAQCLCSELMV